MDREWEELVRAAREVQQPRQISSFIEAGGVAAAVLSENGNIYTGVCVDTCCSLGICAERSAIFSMITHGENALRRVVALMEDGKAGAPCGACREFIMQLMPQEGRNIEILLSQEPFRTVRLGELTPAWWTET